MDRIVTPVRAEVFKDLLQSAGYDPKNTEYLYEGFKNGFDLQYQGPLTKAKRLAPNLKLRVGSPIELWNKVMKEVELGRYAGPFKDPPFEHFVQSPIGLVPKDKGKKTRLIFHLSYPRTSESVNSGIPKRACSMRYPDFEEAVKMCLSEGRACKIAKSDMSSAFRHVPLNKKQWYLMIMMAKHPVTLERFYFVDKCLPFGSSISCAIFQAVSDAISFLVQVRVNKINLNYLDDYLFAAAFKRECDRQVKEFLQVCQEINFPVALEKTFWGTTVLIFLGLLLDTERQLVCIPLDKLNKALNMVEFFLNKRNKKATVLQFQKLCGSLNFLCRCILPGRAFLRRLYISGISEFGLKQHHHIRISKEHRLDLMIWREFLKNPDVYYRPFMELGILDAIQIDMYSDASRNFTLGFGAYCGPHWCHGQWDATFCNQVQPSIEYLELYALTVGVLNWLHMFKNRKIILFCDNEAVVAMVNKSSSKCKNCMVLIRLIVLTSLVNNSRVYVRYVRSKDNGKADALSRFQMERFWKLSQGHHMNEQASPIPQDIWPLSKIWIRSPK